MVTVLRLSSSFRFVSLARFIFTVSCLVEGLIRLNRFLKLAFCFLPRFDDPLFGLLLGDDRSLLSDLSDGEEGGVGGRDLVAGDRLALSVRS